MLLGKRLTHNSSCFYPLHYLSIGSLKTGLIYFLEIFVISNWRHLPSARLAQSVEHETLNLRVVGSSPTLGEAVSFVFLEARFL